MTGDLVAFLRARLDEDEQAAKALNMAARFLDKEPDFYGAGGPAAEKHWQRFDPARVLAEADAKRRILAEHRQTMPGWCVTCDIPGDARGNLHGCLTLRLLALPYRDHPDYRAEWAPEES